MPAADHERHRVVDGRLSFPDADSVFSRTVLSDTVFLFISFSKSTPPQNRQLKFLVSDSKQ